MTVALVLAQASDALTFWFAMTVVGVPLAAESNPAAAALYAGGGILALILFKGLLTLVMLALAYRVKRPRLRAGALGLGMVLGLIGAASNIIGSVRWVNL